MSEERVAFREGPIDGVTFRPLAPHKDHRGWLIELYREDELPAGQHPVMAYVSETLPGVARGPHEHVDQADYFAFVGPGEFLLYLWDARTASVTYWRSSSLVSGQANTAPSAAAIRFPLTPLPCGTVTAAPFLYVPGSTFNSRDFAGSPNCAAAVAAAYAQEIGSVQPNAGYTSWASTSLSKFIGESQPGPHNRIPLS